jgi:hypothetical protein
LRIKRLWLLEDIFLLVPAQASPAGSPKIVQPINMWAIGQHDHKATIYRPDPDRDLVRFPAAPANVAQKRERAEGRAGNIAQYWIDKTLDKGSDIFVVFAHPFFSWQKIVHAENVYLISSQLPPRGRRMGG